MSDKTRDKILTVATKLFGRYGFNKTSMDEIAKIARKAKGSLYYHFHSKEVLFTEVVKREMTNLRQELIKVIQNINFSATEKLKQYIVVRMNYIEHAVNYNETVRADFFEHYDFIDDLRNEIDRFEKAQLEIILLQGIKEGSFKEIDDLSVALDTLIMLLKGMELTYFLKDSPEKANPPFEKVADILINGITQ
jgi:AcrR family transcriptional regulator